jgi:hypothetical protein
MPHARKRHDWRGNTPNLIWKRVRVGQPIGVTPQNKIRKLTIFSEVLILCKTKPSAVRPSPPTMQP